MSRFKILKANPRRSLAALATVLVAVGITGASGASFTAQSANPSNTFAAGTLEMTNSENAAILTASNMRPGDPATKGEVTIKNDGSLSGDFTLSKGTLTDTGAPGLSNVLNVVVTDCGPDQNCSTVGDNPPAEYSGTLAAMGTGISLDNWAADEEHTYEFAVDLDGTADNSHQGDSTEVEFVWNAS